MTDPTPTVTASEHDVQVALFEWAAYQANSVPELALMFAIPNGGHRHKAVAGKMKAEGVKAGVPDIFIPAPRAIYHGCFIELKVGKNRPTEEQAAWLTRLQESGYFAAVCYGFDDARQTIEGYLSMGNRAIEVQP